MADRVGQQLGHYRLIRLLGRGGFAEVYLGEHLRLKTQVAVKILHTSLDEDDVVGFLREAQTVAHLKHPHIVRVFDFDVENQTPYLVMDYLPNGNVRRSYPKGRPLALETVVSYVRQVASALQYANDQKLIHRDIKPENMLLDRDNSIVLSDFGIALMAQSTRYQNTQEVAGTAAYMAPEQFQGHPHRASDQYALGVVVYEWLTGDRPFHGSFTEIASQHLFVQPPSLRKKVPLVSSEIEQVVLTALEKDPHKRFSSVQAFATALEQACQPAPLHQVTFPKETSVPGDGMVAASPVQTVYPAEAIVPPGQTLPLTGIVPPPASGELSPGQLVQPPVMDTPPSQAAPQALLARSEVPNTSRGISRRTAILGLGLAGLTVVGGGIALLSHAQGPQVSYRPSTPPSPTVRPTLAPTTHPTLTPTTHPRPSPTVRPTPSPTARPTSAPTARPTPPPVTSILQGSVAAPPSQVNLTSEGTRDWIHWGLYTGGTVDRKSGVPQQISTFSTIGNIAAIAYSGNYVAYSWSDGTPHPTVTNTTTAVYITGVNNGFSFSVPASTTTQTLRVYLDVYLSQGKFTAVLNDGSGLIYTDSLNNTGSVTQAVYTLTFRGSSNGQQLVLTFVEVNSYNNVANIALEAATLQ
jgi:serine/threonine protein kinase